MFGYQLSFRINDAMELAIVMNTHVKSVNIKTIDFLPSKINQQIETRKNA